MSAYEQPLVIHDRRAELRDFTAEIAAADSPEDQRKLLAEKQAALHAWTSAHDHHLSYVSPPSKPWPTRSKTRSDGSCSSGPRRGRKGGRLSR